MSYQWKSSRVEGKRLAYFHIKFQSFMPFINSGDRLTISVGKSLGIGNMFAHVEGSKTRMCMFLLILTDFLHI